MARSPRLVRKEPIDLVPNVIADIVRPDVLRPATSEEALAKDLGVRQSTFNKWKNRATWPCAENLKKLLAMHRSAVCHHWDCEKLFPLCAISEQYPPTLKSDALVALAKILNDTSLSHRISHVGAAVLEVDLHIRAAELPPRVSAYTFVNDLKIPSVFVVLVSAAFEPRHQQAMAWREIYAHVVNYSGTGREIPPLQAAQSPIRHYTI